MKSKEYEFYNSVNNWDFSSIKRVDETLTNWDMNQKIRDAITKDSKVLDLGTGGGEKVLKTFPVAKEILGTDYSEAMIKTARENLQKSGKKHITFRVMDSLKMDTPDDYFDVVTARHTVTNPAQIYKTLKPGGTLIIRGVDKLDCWDLKLLFGRGQAFKDKKPISQIDYEAVIKAGFLDVELVLIHVREYYQTQDDLLRLLLKTPILNEFSEKIDPDLLKKYIKMHQTKKGILLVRRYYGITAKKPC